MQNTPLYYPCVVKIYHNTVIPWYLLGGWFLLGSKFWDTLRIPKSIDAQVPNMKWCRTVHTVDPLHLWIPNGRSKKLFLICGCKIWAYRGATVYLLKKLGGLLAKMEA